MLHCGHSFFAPCKTHTMANVDFDSQEFQQNTQDGICSLYQYTENSMLVPCMRKFIQQVVGIYQGSQGHNTDTFRSQAG